MAKVTITLGVPGPVASGVAFNVSVTVESGPPGQEARVALRQSHGYPGYPGAVSPVVLDAAGGGAVVYNVTLTAPAGGASDAVLVATGSDDASTYYSPDAKYIQVQG